MRADHSPEPSRPWRSAALVSLALLAVPFLLWLFLPAPAAAPRAPRSAAAGASPAPAAASPRSAKAARGEPAGRRAPVDQPAVAKGEDIEGDVTDPDGKPAPDATVTCVKGEREISASTDENGHFRMDAEAAGCDAAAHKRGFGASETYPLRGGGDNRFRLTPPSGLAGVVVDEAGAPEMIYSIAVESYAPPGGAADAGARPGRKIAIAVNDQDGAFEWTELPPGRYTVAASVHQRPIVRLRDVEVRPGAMTRGLRLVAAPGAVVVGTVVDESTRKPISGALVFVELGLDLGLKVMPAFTNNGEYRLEGAPLGAFDLHVTHLGYTEHIAHGLTGTPGGELRVDVGLQRKGP